MRHETIRKHIDGICGNMRHYVNNAPDMCWTFERFMEYLAANVFARPHYAKLPQWAKSEIGGFWRAVFDRYDAENLFWTYVLDGERILSKLHENKIDAHPVGWPAVDANECGSAYVFKAGVRLIIVPWRQEERESEIAAGRLHPEDVAFVINRQPFGEVVRLKPTHSHRPPVIVKVQKGELV